MTLSDLSTDGSIVLRVLSAPGLVIPAVVSRRRAAVALAIATAASLASAAVVLPRVDFGAGRAAERPGGEELTPYEREQAAATARKLGQIGGLSRAALLPAALAAAAAAGLFAGFRVAGTRPGYRATLAVTAHGMLPLWLGGLLAIPAAVAHAPVPAPEVPRLLPSSLAALLPPDAPAPLAAALSAFDLFTAWALVLVVMGMARASGATRTRAAATTLLLFLSCVALFKVVPAAQLGGSGFR
jgi:hypothetical protein